MGGIFPLVFPRCCAHFENLNIFKSVSYRLDWSLKLDRGYGLLLGRRDIRLINRLILVLLGL